MDTKKNKAILSNEKRFSEDEVNEAKGLHWIGDHGIRIETPGGGGFGNPLERPLKKVIMDVKNGLVSKKGAREDYGVIFTD